MILEVVDLVPIQEPLEPSIAAAGQADVQGTPFELCIAKHPGTERIQKIRLLSFCAFPILHTPHHYHTTTCSFNFMQVIGTSAFFSSFISAYCAHSRTGTPTTVIKMKAVCVFLAALSSVALADEPVPATALGNWAGKHSQSFALANASDPNRYVVEAGVSRSRLGTCAPRRHSCTPPALAWFHPLPSPCLLQL